MYINDKRYDTDLNEINKLKYLLLINLYKNEEYIESLKNCISNRIDCISIEYNQSTYTFDIKIKKTSMRKIKGFDNSSNFYYTITPYIFQDFIKSNEKYIVSILNDNGYSNSWDILNNIYSDPSILCNLCSVFCYSGNALSISLK